MTDFPQLNRYPYGVIDTESTGLEWFRHRLFGISVSLPDGRDFYFDIRNPAHYAWARGELPKLKHCIYQNSKHDLHHLREAGIPLDSERADDTVVRAALIDEHLHAYDLDTLGQKYVGVGKDTSIYARLAGLFGGQPTKSAQIKNLHRAPPELAAKYATQDSRTTLKLWEWQETEIKRQGLESICAFERELIPTLYRMEMGGVRVDLEATEEAIKLITAEIDAGYAFIRETTGKPDFNINSPPQVIAFFKPVRQPDGWWHIEGGDRVPSTDGGSPSFGQQQLSTMRHPLGQKIHAQRKLLKLRDTFLKGHILGSQHNGVVHTTFNQTKTESDQGTGTGRLSATKPAMQQIPARDAMMAEVMRRLFVPDPGHRWLNFDLSQIDFRFMAHYVRNPRIIDSYQQNPELDFHQMVGDMTGLPRTAKEAGKAGGMANAKQINLALTFGMGMGRLAKEMGLPFEMKIIDGRPALVAGEKSKSIFEHYHREIPGIREFLKKAEETAKTRGYVRSMMGRHLRFPHRHGTHKAGGLLFQSATADLIKLKMIELDALLREQGAGSRLTLSVHDEVCISWAGSPDAAVVKERFEDCGPGSRMPVRVPIRSKMGVGDNWWLAGK